MHVAESVYYVCKMYSTCTKSLFYVSTCGIYSTCKEALYMEDKCETNLVDYLCEAGDDLKIGRRFELQMYGRANVH